MKGGALIKDFHFMRLDKVDLLRYLPPFLAKSPTFKDAQDTLSWKHEQYRLKLVDTAKQFFLETATWGLADWERFLKITPAKDSTFEARKAVCRVKLRGLETMTPQNTIRLMEEFFTSGHAAVEELGDNEIKLILDNGVFYWNELCKALWEFLPAHLIWSIEFNRHFNNDFSIATANNYAGDKNIGNAKLEDSAVDLSISNTCLKGGQKTVGLNFDAASVDKVKVGSHILRGGYVEIGADLDDLNYEFEDPVPTDPDEGEIDPSKPVREVFPDGNFLRLYFKFPNTKRVRYTTIRDPRKGVTSKEINAVGNSAAKNKLIMNRRGDFSTGITRALLIERTIEKVF